MDPTDEKAVNILSRHLEPGEQVRGVVAGYTLSGFGRRVVAVTDRRVLVVKSGYLTLSDKGLLWADPLEGVCLWEKVHEGKSVMNTKSGNAMVRFRRADDDGSFGFNPRSGYFSRDGMQGAANLFELIPGRFS